MEHQLFAAILPLLLRLDQTPRRTRHTYSDADIVAAYLWAVLHDRSQAWACMRENWPLHLRRRPISKPPALSERLRTPSVIVMLQKLFTEFCAPKTPGVLWLLDGKALPVSGISGDPQAVCGRGAGGFARGYKLHVIMTISGEIAACEIHPMNVDERVAGLSMIENTTLQGYLTADANYDSNVLHEACDKTQNLQLITPRRCAKTAKSPGHRQQSLGRKRCLDLWSQPRHEFLEGLHKSRSEIERHFGQLVSTTGGLGPLPAWVRGLLRVTRWVRAKLLLHALRRRLGIRTYVA